MCCFVILSAANLMTERQQATKMAQGPVSVCFLHMQNTIRDALSTVRTQFTLCLHVLHGLHCQAVLHCLNISTYIVGKVGTLLEWADGL